MAWRGFLAGSVPEQLRHHHCGVGREEFLLVEFLFTCGLFSSLMMLGIFFFYVTIFIHVHRGVCTYMLLVLTCSF